MVNLVNRSNSKELLDDDDIPFDHIRQNMQELNTINTLLGGHAVTLAGIKHFIKSHPPGEIVSVCEIGCGGGDNLAAIASWCNKKKITAAFTGIDIKPACIEFARQQYPDLNATWITSDYSAVEFTGNQPAVIFSSLFCHHFTEKQLVNMIGWMKQHSKKGFFINDLHRHVLAYYSIKLLTSLFSKSYLVKNDAPLSVARGFTIPEWKNLLDAASLSGYQIQWKWAFRHLIVYEHGQ